MAFQICDLNEDEKREYTLTMWPRCGQKLTPDGCFMDRENDIRLYCYGNGSYMEPCNEYQFIFDYKGTAMNVNIGQNCDGDTNHYSLIEVQGNENLSLDEIMPSLREAIKTYGNRKFSRGLREDESDKIFIDF